MEKAYKYRIYPNKKQKEIITKTFGCCRFVYNTYLAKRIKAYEKDKITFTYNMCSKDLTNLKKELKWLKEVDSTALQSSLKNLDTAYQKFFRNILVIPNSKQRKHIDIPMKQNIVMEISNIITNILNYQSLEW